MKKIMVSAADYEMYRFLMPWKCLFAHEKKFILGELEKKHPRFSGSCCYDTKYVLCKKNLFAEVVVMEKANLARYKNAGGELFLESEKKRSVFSKRAKMQRILSVLLLLIAGLLSLRIARSLFFENAGSVASSGIVLEDSSVAENDSELETEQKLSGEALLKEVFLSVSRRGGKISAFSFESNSLPTNGNLAGECKFSIHGCNSEEVANAQYCVVSFKDNEPHFELVLPFTVPFDEANANQANCIEESEISETAPIFSYENDLLAVTAVRKQLRDLGAIIESEHNGETSAEFSFVTDASVLYSCLKICGESAEKSCWRTKQFSVTERAGKCRVQTSFLKEKQRQSFSPILLAAQHAYLFGSELKIQPKVKKLFPVPAATNPLVMREKLGEVRKNDGSVFICYRTIDGKMTFEKKAM